MTLLHFRDVGKTHKLFKHVDARYGIIYKFFKSTFLDNN